MMKQKMLLCAIYNPLVVLWLGAYIIGVYVEPDVFKWFYIPLILTVIIFFIASIICAVSTYAHWYEHKTEEFKKETIRKMKENKDDN